MGADVAVVAARPGGRLTARTRAVAGPPLVAVRVWLRGGARGEEIPGQALVCGRLLTEGSRRRDWRTIAEAAEARGMAVEGCGGFEAIGLGIDALADDWELALEWAAELTLEPLFSPERCGWVVRQTRAELESLADRPEVVTGWRFLDQLYRPHPRSRPLQGSAEGLRRLTSGDCARFHRDSLDRGVVVTVAGSVDSDAASRRVRELFAGLEAGPPAPPPEPGAPAGIPETRTAVTISDGGQAHLYLGHLTVARRDPDYPALELLGVVLGSGVTGRIPERVREREGLAYVTYADTVAGAGTDPGRLVVYLGTSPAELERAEGAVREELGNLVEKGVSAPEMEQARSYLLGREPFRRETARQWADLLAEAELSGLPLDRTEWVAAGLRALDRDRVDEAARRHLRPEKLRVTVGLPGPGGGEEDCRGG